MPTFTRISLTHFKKYSAYSLDEKLIVFHLESASLYLLDELSAWLFLSLDAGFSSADLKHELIDNQIDAELLEGTFETIDNLLHPPFKNTIYQHEYEALINAPSIALLH